LQKFHQHLGTFDRFHIYGLGKMYYAVSFR